MATTTIPASTSSNTPSVHSDAPLAPINNIADPLHLSPQVDGRVEPYELVELFYGSNSGSPATTQTSQNSPRSVGTSSPEIMQVIDQSKPKPKALPDSYTCEVCTRVFKEASHYTKHKRGALCRKLAQRLAKQKKKKKSSLNSDQHEKRKQIPTIVHKPYQCNICGAKFCDKVNVELHLERTHNTKQQEWVEITKNGGFSCAECDRWFQNKANLDAHQRQHVLSSGQQHPQQQPDRLNQSVEVATSDNRATNVNSTLTTTAAIATQPASVMYHQQNRMQMYVHPGQHPPPPLHLTQPPPPAPPMVHMHNALPTLLHTPQMPLPGTIIPASHNLNLVNKPSQMPMITGVSMQNSTPISNVVESGSKNIKMFKNNKFAGNSKWNVCGDCGHKFVDPMNLELHIQRKHPESYMIETVNLGGGTVLYKTNNTSSDIQCFLNENGTSSSCKTNTSPEIQGFLNENVNNSFIDYNKQISKTNSQSFDCILCGYKATSRNHIIYHLQNVHTTSNTNFIHVIENLESSKKSAKVQSQIKKSELQDPLLREQRHICEACNETFLSKAELIRHRIKDKKYMCGVCCHASCSQEQVSTHMATHHPVASAENISSSSNSNNAVSSLICWFCGSLCASVPGLDQHLASHGNLSAECTYCGQQSGTLETLLPHVAIHLPRQTCSIRLTVSRPDQLPVVHMVEVSVDGNVNSTSNGNSSNNQTCSNQNEVLQNGDKVIPENATPSTSRQQPAYACSQCGTCLAEAAQLESHLQLHQNTHTSTKQDLKSMATSSCMTTLPTSSAASALTASTSTSMPSLINQQGCGVTKSPGTIGFRCEECGFWRHESEPVMRHIQTHHMSGNMLHSVKLPTGNVQVYPIYVVTPISTQET
ncbi:unnamed protein product [Meganyctiphanes norvegica]|uniref:C2H2-type domain-containing protein n=1 Tax=Meganyctiphanes norvegica TaxID=48144 RepID=A0AAV2RTI5_MEGNR